MLEDGITIDEAEEIIEEDEEDEEDIIGSRKLIVYDKSRKGFYVNQYARHFQESDIRLMAECIYAAKFIPQNSAERLANVVLEYVSEPQAAKIKHDSIVVDRVKTLNKAVLTNIGQIRDAMAKELDGKKHIPEKISFNYLKHEIKDLEKTVERRDRYIMSPYYLIINDGNYYLIAYSDEAKEERRFRVDRMRNLRLEGVPRSGDEYFKTFDIKTYTQRVFSMFGGKKTRVKLQFVNSLLDTVIDRFGTKDPFYSKADDKHFIVNCEVEISPQFFSWLCGLDTRVVILEPEDVKEQYQNHLKKILKKYSKA